ncbi:hypothetical protein [Candidatus Electronema sp. JM]|uniref:hypothetical protein n=1 Tax=Candidatus Electronema sp. JM TaxID=3401571 RepID=UPI003AA800E2
MNWQVSTGIFSLLIGMLLVIPEDSTAKTISFSGYDWIVKSGKGMGPGPNNWSEDNVWVDSAGQLHLKITKIKGKWYCGEVKTLKPLGFGQYKWELAGNVDQLDKNAVLGLFNYPTADIGPDGTNEIDIEIAQWSKIGYNNGNFGVYPAVEYLQYQNETETFSFSLQEPYISTHQFVWKSDSVAFRSQQGDDNILHEWTYAPAQYETYIPQNPMPVHMNFWLYKGHKLSRGNDAEVIVKKFEYIPEVPTVTSLTGRVWMDRNLGASRAATSSTDAEAYGDLYQWGRLTDGHEKRTSGTTTTLSSTDVPGHGDFIMTSTYNWMNPPNFNLWQGANGINNPCPKGFRIPTAEELEDERLSWSSNDAAGAFSSPLKFVMGGLRTYQAGSIVYTGSYGGYWSDTAVPGSNASYLLAFKDSSASSASSTGSAHAHGLSVRCIQALPEETP